MSDVPHRRDLPERLGDYRSVKRRYYRWIEMRKLAQPQTTFAVSEPSFSARRDAERPAADPVDEMWDTVGQRCSCGA
ncbi:transposase [Rhizobium laguerreae]|uniref:Uncharacterized protein n=1 Tax=Rhizobium laguerreae TaxID=1076926 RepID=A0A6N9ZF49_9HYPH|nr:transposase [Rhizobium laguerreae]NEH91861.1 hypothetical protein [Rhizobium laguerreae]